MLTSRFSIYEFIIHLLFSESAKLECRRRVSTTFPHLVRERFISQLDERILIARSRSVIYHSPRAQRVRHDVIAAVIANAYKREPMALNLPTYAPTIAHAHDRFV